MSAGDLQGTGNAQGNGQGNRHGMRTGVVAALVAAALFGASTPLAKMLPGLTHMPASGASLLLNAEGVFTALTAWCVFKENFDRRIALGMLAIVAGSVVLVWPGATVVGAAALLGLASYGVGLTLFVVALRHLGTARTGAYFSVAPFWGALLAVGLLGEPVAPCCWRAR